MGYTVFQHLYTTCKAQIRIMGISIISNIYHFFVFGTFKVLFTCYFEIYNYLLSSSYPTTTEFYIIPHFQMYPITTHHPLLSTVSHGASYPSAESQSQSGLPDLILLHGMGHSASHPGKGCHSLLAPAPSSFLAQIRSQ